MTQNHDNTNTSESNDFYLEDIYSKFLTPKDYEIEKVSDKEMVFKLAPLERGFGHLFGYMFRRVFLSSMLGTAIVKVSIEGVTHEYTTLPGVVQDVQTILLNLKDVVIQSNHGDIINLNLNVKGPACHSW